LLLYNYNLIMMEKILKYNSIFIIILILTGILLYFNSFYNPLFWDDYDGILNNTYIQNWQYWPRFFTENLIAGAGFLSDYWRPMVLMFFSLGWHFWGDNHLGYHLINIFLHIANSIFLFLILKKITKKTLLGFLIALIFLIHPVQTEAVTYISGIADPLSVFFIFSGLIFYLIFLEKNKKFFYFLSLISFIFSLMSKETAIIMPLLIFLIGWIKIEEKNSKEKIKKLLIQTSPFLFLALTYFILRISILNFKNTLNLYNEKNFFTSRIDIRLFSFFKTLPIYFSLLFFPWVLHMERSMAIPQSIFDPLALSGLIIFVFLVFLALKNFKKNYFVSLGIFWFFITIFPMSNILIPISGLIYEHWLYLPIIGIFLALFFLIIPLIKKWQLEKLALAVLIVFLIFLSLRTIIRNAEWGNPVFFYQQILKYNPKSYRVWNNLGIEAEKRNNYLIALDAYTHAVEIDSSNPTAYHNLGVLYFKMGQLDLAENYFKKAIENDKTFFYSYLLLSKLYWQKNQLDKTKEILFDYLNNIQKRADMFFVLSEIDKAENNLIEAKNYLSEAIKLDPNNQVYKEVLKELEKYK